MIKFALAAILIVPLAGSAAEDLPVVKPEQVGLSTERLGRIRDALEARIKRQELSGAVALVARHGKIAYFEVLGLMDVDKKKPMQRTRSFGWRQ